MHLEAKMVQLTDALGGCDQASLVIHLEGAIVELRDALERGEWTSLEMHLEAMIDQHWRTWRRSIGGAPGAAIHSISLSSCNCGNAMRWPILWALMESWLVAVNLVGRHARRWSYIQRSTRNRENEWTTDNPGCMLYSMYAVLSVNSLSRHGEIERDDLTLCSVMMVEKEREGIKMGTNMEDTSRYEQSGVQLAWLG